MSSDSNIRLADMTVGKFGLICSMGNHCNCGADLRKMGLREGLEIEVLSEKNPMMLRFDNTKLAICKEMVRDVFVLDLKTKNASVSDNGSFVGKLKNTARTIFGA
tara:strand:+ start:190 stop:504 length:315 start_codon:yes stop_codon:yes gene_type:complete